MFPISCLMTSFSCAPFPIAAWKKLASRLQRDAQAVFSQISRQQPTKISSEDSAFAYESVRQKSIRQPTAFSKSTRPTSPPTASANS